MRIRGHSLRLCYAFCIVLYILGSYTAVAQSIEADRGFHRTPLTATTTTGESLNLYGGSHALLIGASRYEQWGALTSIPEELDELESALVDQNFLVKRLRDPSYRELKVGIENFISQYGYEKSNRLLIFFAGHGHSEGDRGFLIPVDAPTPDKWTEFRRRALPMTQVIAWARTIESKHVLFVFDSCFSGTVFKSRNLPRSQDRYIRKATERPVRQFLTAGSAGEMVPAKSTFTPALVEAIRGAGDTNNDGYVTGNELGVHLSQLVPRYTDQTPQFGSIRDYELGQGDFVFFSAAATDEVSNEVVNTELTNSTNNQVAELPVDLLDNALWQAATQDNTESSYERYLERFPQGVFAGIAIDRKLKLKQSRELQEAEEARQKAEASKRAKEVLSSMLQDEKNRLERAAQAEKKEENERLNKESEARQKKEEAQRQLRESIAAQQQQSEESQQAELIVVQQALAGLRNGYFNAIRQRVERNWRRPADLDSRVNCTVSIKQNVAGEVLEVAVDKCENGNAALQKSVENAVWAASPLPAAPDPKLFDQRVRFYFRPAGS